LRSWSLTPLRASRVASTTPLPLLVMESENMWQMRTIDFTLSRFLCYDIMVISAVRTIDYRRDGVRVAMSVNYLTIPNLD
jgi:hypothetical protein